MKTDWYSNKEPFVGAKWESMRTIEDNRFEIAYTCPNRWYTTVELLVTCDSTQERDWMFYRAFGMTHSKPYVKGLRQKLQELNKEYKTKEIE